MEKTASQIQKERIKELEDKANALIARCDVATLTSINEKGYPRTCLLSIAKADGFSDVYFCVLGDEAAVFAVHRDVDICHGISGFAENGKFRIGCQQNRAAQKGMGAERRHGNDLCCGVNDGTSRGEGIGGGACGCGDDHAVRAIVKNFAILREKGKFCDFGADAARDDDVV